MPKHNSLTQEQFIADCNERHGLGTYDYSEVVYVRGRDKIKVICPKHGAWYPAARKHREGNGCRKCYYEEKKLPQETIQKRFLTMHGDIYEYNFSSYNGSNSTIKIKCAEHGWFSQICEVHAIGSGCPTCGGLKSTASRIVSFAEFVVKANERFDSIYQYIEGSWKGIGESIDFICPKHGLKTILAQSHLRSPTGCFECSNEFRSINSRLTQDDFITRSTAVHNGKYDYSRSAYTKGRDVLEIICPIHGSFFQRGESHVAGKGCKKCADLENGRRKMEQSEVAFWKQVKAVHGDTYDFSKSVYTGIFEDMTVGCPIHGDFTISASSIRRGSGCYECGRERIRLARNSTIEEFIEKAVVVHGNKYSYENVKYVTAKTEVMITCKIHGDFPQIPTNHLSGNGCSACGNYGFDKTLPATLYYLKVRRDNAIAYKIGITNRSIKERFYSEMDQITVLYAEQFEHGIDAYKKEQQILAQYAEHKYVGSPILSSGNTELFSEDVLDLDSF
jgi:hypothetical protein